MVPVNHTRTGPDHISELRFASVTHYHPIIMTPLFENSHRRIVYAVPPTADNTTRKEVGGAYNSSSEKSG
jgi:hypothetical protein